MKVLRRVFLWEIDGVLFFSWHSWDVHLKCMCVREGFGPMHLHVVQKITAFVKKIKYSILIWCLFCFFLWLCAFIKCGYTIKKRALLDVPGPFTKCRRELSLGTKNEIALALWNGYTSVHLPSDSTGAHLSQSWKSLLLKWHCLLTARLGTQNQIWVWLTYSIVPWF